MLSLTIRQTPIGDKIWGYIINKKNNNFEWLGFSIGGPQYGVLDLLPMGCKRETGSGLKGKYGKGLGRNL